LLRVRPSGAHVRSFCTVRNERFRGITDQREEPGVEAVEELGQFEKRVKGGGDYCDNRIHELYGFARTCLRRTSAGTYTSTACVGTRIHALPYVCYVVMKKKKKKTISYTVYRFHRCCRSYHSYSPYCGAGIPSPPYQMPAVLPRHGGTYMRPVGTERSISNSHPFVVARLPDAAT
jgi:hypothetical protein